MLQSFKVVDRDLEDLIVPLETGVKLAGRIDPPEKGARVSLEVEPENIGLGNLSTVIGAGFVRASSDEKGEFVLAGVPPGKLVLKARTADGREGKLPVEVADRDQSGLVVKLETRGAISGRVVDADGKPVDSVRVKADQKDGPTSTSMGFDRLLDRGAPTGADGSFRIGGLAAGTYAVAVRDDHGPLAFVPEKTVEIVIEGTREVKDVLLTIESRNGVIRGVVVGPNGAATPDAWVTATRKPPEKPKPPEGQPPPAEKRTVTVSVGIGSEGAQGKVEQTEGDEVGDGLFESREERPVLTDASGRFVIEKLRKGTYDLVAQSTKNGLRGEARGARPGDNVTIRLESMGELSGAVSAAGAPVADYLLSVKGPREHSARVRKPDGGYAVRRLPPGKYRVSARADAGTAHGEIEVKSGDQARLDLAMTSWGKITGTVIDGTTGKPWKGLSAIATSKDDLDEEAIMQMIQGGGPKTDEAGRFTIGRLGPGEGSVVFVAGSLISFQLVAQKKFVLADGQTLDLGVLKALPKPPKPAAPGVLGLETEEKQGVLAVTKVVAEGAAAQAGVAVGDVILGVDGFTVADYGADVIEQLLDGDAVGKGQVVAVLFDKKGELRVTAR
jgi:hypothetical protein